MIKRSLSLYGHRTSIALEAEFWAVIDDVISARQQSLAGFIREQDDARIAGGPTRNLASHLRVWALREVQR